MVRARHAAALALTVSLAAVPACAPTERPKGGASGLAALSTNVKKTTLCRSTATLHPALRAPFESR